MYYYYMCYNISWITQNMSAQIKNINPIYKELYFVNIKFCLTERYGEDAYNWKLCHSISNPSGNSGSQPPPPLPELKLETKLGTNTDCLQENHNHHCVYSINTIHIYTY